MLLTWSDAVPNLFRREPVRWAGAFDRRADLPSATSAAVAGGLGVLFVIVYHRPDWAYAAVFFAPFFLFPVKLHSYFFPMSELLILTTGVAWVARSLAAGDATDRARRTSRQHFRR